MDFNVLSRMILMNCGLFFVNSMPYFVLNTFTEDPRFAPELNKFEEVDILCWQQSTSIPKKIIERFSSGVGTSLKLEGGEGTKYKFRVGGFW